MAAFPGGTGDATPAGERRRLLGNTGWQMADQLARMTVGLVIGVWLARYLGPEDFGLFNYVLAFVGLFAALSHLGLDDIIVRDVVRDPANKDEILGSALILKMAGGSASFILAVAIISVLRPGDPLSHGLVAIIAAAAVFQAGNVIEFWFHARTRIKYAVLAKSAAFLGVALLKIGLILARAPLAAFAWAALLEALAASGGLFLVYRLTGNPLRSLRFSLIKAGELLKSSWPLLGAGIVITIYLRIDQVMLGQIAGSTEVGIYAVAVRLAEVWFFIPTAIYWSLFPAIVQAKADDEEIFYQRLQKLYNLVALAAYAVAVPVTILAGWVVPLLFGEAYAGAGMMLAVLIWSNVFVSLEMARSAFLTAMNWTRLYLLTVSLGCVINIGLNFWLIPLYGGLGAVFASLLAYWFAAHGSCFLFRPLFRTGFMLTRALVYPKVW